MNCVRLKTAGKTMAPWILLTNAEITAREAAQYDAYRWRIESDCKVTGAKRGGSCVSF